MYSPNLSQECKPEVPKITKNVNPLRWLESFKDCLFRTFGVRGCPSLYVVRGNEDVPLDEDDPLQPGKSYGSSSSVLEEMMQRLTRRNTLFMNDNASVYSMLEEETRSTIYAPTIKPYTIN